jgi:hypothetical protein
MCRVGEIGGSERTCTRKTLRSFPPEGSAMRFDMPFPQYVASFSKRTFVSGSVSGRISKSCVRLSLLEVMRSRKVRAAR